MPPHLTTRGDNMLTSPSTSRHAAQHATPPTCETRQRTAAAVHSSRYATLRPRGDAETAAAAAAVLSGAATYSARTAANRLRGRRTMNATSAISQGTLLSSQPTTSHSGRSYGNVCPSGPSPRANTLHTNTNIVTNTEGSSSVSPTSTGVTSPMTNTRPTAPPLRYRTDLDKPVIHFAFAHVGRRAWEEVVVPRSSPAGPPSSNTNTSQTTSTTHGHHVLPTTPSTTSTTSSRASQADLRSTADSTSNNNDDDDRSSGSSSHSHSHSSHKSGGSFGHALGNPATSTNPPNAMNMVEESNDDVVANTALGEWNVFWMSVGRVHAIFANTEFRLGDTQIINHFPNHHELTRKDLMYKNIKRYLREAHAGRPSMSTATANNAVLNSTNTTSSSIWAQLPGHAHEAAAQVRRGTAPTLTERPRLPHPTPLPLRPLTLLYPRSWAAARACAEAAAAAATNNNNSSNININSMRSNNSTGANMNTLAALTRSMPGLQLGAFCFADSVPVTYNIPNDLNMFIEEFKRRPNQTWIVKPAARSQGKGIFLINRIQQLTRRMRRAKTAATSHANAAGEASTTAAPRNARQARTSETKAIQGPSPAPRGSGRSAANSNQPPARPATKAKAPQPLSDKNKAASAANDETVLGSFIISRYIADPLLIAGCKFDLRLYVLVLSFKPLVAYLHRCGFARCCSTPYSSTDLAEEDLGSHLTNVALQKHDEHYNAVHGGKLTLDNLWLYIQGRFGPYAAETLLVKIEYLVYHSLKAVADVIFNDKHCFELYGYDILIDNNLEPHLIEVNASPSLTTTTDADRWLKEEVLVDTLRLVLPQHFPGPRSIPYWEHRTRTDWAKKQQTGFHLLSFEQPNFNT